MNEMGSNISTIDIVQERIIDIKYKRNDKVIKYLKDETKEKTYSGYISFTGIGKYPEIRIRFEDDQVNNILYLASLIYKNEIIKQYIKENYEVNYNILRGYLHLIAMEDVFDLISIDNIKPFNIRFDVFINLAKLNKDVNNKNVDKFLKDKIHKKMLINTIEDKPLERSFATYIILKDFFDEGFLDVYIIKKILSLDFSKTLYMKLEIFDDITNINLIIREKHDLNMLTFFIINYLLYHKDFILDLIKDLIEKNAILLPISIEDYLKKEKINETRFKYTKDLLSLLESSENFDDFIQINRNHMLRNSDDETLDYLLTRV